MRERVTVGLEVRRFRTLALVTGAATYLLVVMGGTVKAYGAGLACPDWPLCYGKGRPGSAAV